MDKLNRHKKLKSALTYWLLGRKYHNALSALTCAESYHFKDENGNIRLRKDKKTPEFFHQIEIALFITTLEPHLTHPEETICAGLLHAVLEDYNIHPNAISCLFDNVDFSVRVYNAVEKLSKINKSNNTKKLINDYFSEIGQDNIASIVKGIDRINNQQSMVEPFTINKQKEYISETENYILPALKTAQKLYPVQHMAYESIKYVLKSQIYLIQQIHITE